MEDEKTTSIENDLLHYEKVQTTSSDRREKLLQKLEIATDNIDLGVDDGIEKRQSDVMLIQTYTSTLNDVEKSHEKKLNLKSKLKGQDEDRKTNDALIDILKKINPNQLIREIDDTEFTPDNDKLLDSSIKENDIIINDDELLQST